MSMGFSSDWSICRNACQPSPSAAERDSLLALSHSSILGSMSCCFSGTTPSTAPSAFGGTFTAQVPS
jgi:hypothetical protein